MVASLLATSLSMIAGHDSWVCIIGELTAGAIRKWTKIDMRSCQAFHIRIPQQNLFKIRRMLSLPKIITSHEGPLPILSRSDRVAHRPYPNYLVENLWLDCLFVELIL